MYCQSAQVMPLSKTNRAVPQATPTKSSSFQDGAERELPVVAPFSLVLLVFEAILCHIVCSDAIKEDVLLSLLGLL